ncbi:hypothetical protein PDE_04554 [Penicillium oxalicum 114-2]|uniref:WW domain-containing protein n=1 Tax=Penicillium oxalicum (strain 114-2 / CGMCC 5302) TaxID=933388 RepID=S7ZH38_PENO1|nr:hypothetical protein PDE_04554 [Penicillium oxalicum 114-2]
MAQDAPADTAGPSSPPPQLPEGWLPQWEGVGRQWYYVQRATGKSQWEIPTEPVIMTPSSTPGSIGAGPSQAPSNTTTPSHYTTETHQSMEGSMKPVSSFANDTSSASSDVNGQHSHHFYGTPAATTWSSSSHNQQDSQFYKNNTPSDGRDQATSLHPQVGAERSSAFERTKWGQSGPNLWQQKLSDEHRQPSQKIPGKPIDDLTPRHYINFGTDRHDLSQLPDTLSPTLYPHHASQTLEQTHPRTDQSQSPGQYGHHFFETGHGPPQPRSGSFAPRASIQSLPTTSHGYQGGVPDRAESGTSHPNAPSYYEQEGAYSNAYGTLQQPQNSGHGIVSVPPSLSHQLQPESKVPTAHPHSLSSIHCNEQQPPILHRQSVNFNGPADIPALDLKNRSHPPFAQVQEAAQNYRNPLLQASLRHYLPTLGQQNSGMGGTAWQGGNISLSENQYGQIHPFQRADGVTSSRASTSDPQFVSGPWASATPPTYGPSR